MINEKLAKRYCKEDLSKIKNYDLAIADKTQTWDLHHMTETWWNCSKKDLIENECYYNRKACELIFLTRKEHRRLHMQGCTSAFKGRTHSDESRRMMSESHKGEKNSFYGKHHTEETRRKLSEAKKGRTLSEETRIKISESLKGNRHSEETRRKISEAVKRRWETLS